MSNITLHWNAFFTYISYIYELSKVNPIGDAYKNV
jgi:hypothetical protein